MTCRHNRFLWVSAVLCCAFLFYPIPGAAQGPQGTVLGLVTDPAGASCPGADVEIRSEETGMVRTTQTNVEGLYQFPNIPVGSYSVLVSLPGFSSQRRTGIKVTISSEVRVNISMVLGEVSNEVTVTADAQVVNTTSSQMVNLVDAKTVRDMPINGRDWAQLAILEPGVVLNKAQTANDPRNSVQRGSGMQLSISGGRVVDNNFRVDGINVNDYANTAPGSSLGLNLGVDAIQEFAVLSGNFSAQYGRAAGGVVNSVTRAGTNEWHGSAYEFLRNNVLDAANFFDNLAGVKKPARRRNQFGGTYGGPIQKDKMFFFANYEGIRTFEGTTRLSTVLTDKARNGELVAGKVTVHPNIIPYLPIFPRVNVPGSIVGDVGYYAYPEDQKATENFFTLRMDRTFGTKDSLYGTYLIDKADGYRTDELGTTRNTHQTGRHLVAITWNRLVSSQFVNTARVGFSRSTGRNNYNQSLFPELTDNPALSFVPGKSIGRITVSGLSVFIGGTLAPDYNDLFWNSYQAYEDIFWQRGRHALGFGFNIEVMQNNSDSPGAGPGRWTFQSIRDFLTDGTAPGSRAVSFEAQAPGVSTHRALRQKLFGLYIQDDYRVSKRLNLNLGLRWEPTTNITEVNGRMAALRSIYDAASTIGPLFTNPTMKYFSPRVGFAYDPFGNGKTAIRGGFSVYYVLPLTHLVTAMINRALPFYYGVSGDAPAGTRLQDGLKVITSATTVRSAAFEYEAPASYKTQWNLSVQREITSGLGLLVAYTGSRGVHQILQEENIVGNIAYKNPNGTYTLTKVPVNPNYGRLDWRHWGGSIAYHGLQSGLSMRPMHGVQFQGSFTWSKMLDNGSPTYANSEFTSQNFNPLPLDVEYNWGPSDYDLARAFAFSGTWTLPEPSTTTGVRKLLGGWQLGSIFRASDGIGITATVNGDPSGLGSGSRNKQRAKLVSGCSYQSAVHPGQLQYVDQSCFTIPSPITAYETASTRNALRGPGSLDWDFSLVKNTVITRISESFRVQFRAEFFNILNRANFATPSAQGLINTDGSAITNRGVIRSTASPARQIQFGLKLIW